MYPFVSRSLRALLRATRTGRSLLNDLNNRDEFTSLLSHERMLADRVRVDTYHRAIERHVLPGQTVIDLGTGTGVLAMFAARRAAARVHALDHSGFIALARRVARHNGLDNIDFVHINSREYTPPAPVDLIIHEQIGDELLTENMLENLLDLKRRCLKPEGRILPARFELFLEPVELQANRTIPYLWERKVHGLDFSLLGNDPAARRFRPSDYDCYLLEPAAVRRLLCAPEPMLRIDLDSMTSPDELATSFRMARTIRTAGRMDGLALYFRVIFDDQLSFDTSPVGDITHWRWRLFRLPARELQAGDVVRISLDMPDSTSIHSWQVRCAPPATTAGEHAAAPPAGLEADGGPAGQQG